MIRTEIVVKNCIFVLESYGCKVAVARSGEIKRPQSQAMYAKTLKVCHTPKGLHTDVSIYTVVNEALIIKIVVQLRDDYGINIGCIWHMLTLLDHEYALVLDHLMPSVWWPYMKMR